MLGFAAGCGRPYAIESNRATHVIILPGIGGNDPFIDRLRRMIGVELPDVSAQVWDWTQLEWRPSVLNLANLEDYDRNLRRAAVLQQRMVEWRHEHPRDRLYLIGYSGGTGIALFATERLPADFNVEALILIASGVSPDYDLTPALRHTRRGIFNYYSREDRAVLSDLTRKHGTMDRRFSDSAGLVGFKTPTDPKMAARLRQLAWEPSMERSSDNAGGHVGGLESQFALTYFLPLLTGDEGRVHPRWKTADQAP